ncbi:hypothetical protein NMG60_11005941 [Bertholletia excelsa]
MAPLSRNLHCSLFFQAENRQGKLLLSPGRKGNNRCVASVTHKKMARNCDDENRVQSRSSDQNEADEEDEALSLCDLPIQGENVARKEENEVVKTCEDFDFGSRGGSVLAGSEMCAADEVFFQGQILPLRHSISSESGLVMLRPESRNPSRCISRSESMDHSYSGVFTSVSSRSSSIRSQHSSSSGSSTNTTTTTHKQRIRNYFHSHPSPTPQIRVSSSRYPNPNSYTRKSTLWSFFRVGLVRTPEIELQDLKARSNTNRSFGSRNSTSSAGTGDLAGKGSDVGDAKKKKKQRFFDRNGGIFDFGGCKCSVNTVDTIKINNNETGNEPKEEAATKKTKKQAVSRHRTFEWLKELSLAGVPDEA